MSQITTKGPAPLTTALGQASLSSNATDLDELRAKLELATHDETAFQAYFETAQHLLRNPSSPEHLLLGKEIAATATKAWQSLSSERAAAWACNLEMQASIDERLRIAQEALKKKFPDSILLNVLYGRDLQLAGQEDAARKVLHAGFSRTQHPAFFYCLSFDNAFTTSLSKNTFPRLIEEVREKWAPAGMPPPLSRNPIADNINSRPIEEMHYIYLASANCWLAMENIEAAYNCLLIAQDRVPDALVKQSERVFLRRIEEAKSFTKDQIRHVSDSDTPIFVCGSRGSGISLLTRILANIRDEKGDLIADVADQRSTFQSLRQLLFRQFDNTGEISTDFFDQSIDHFLQALSWYGEQNRGCTKPRHVIVNDPLNSVNLAAIHACFPNAKVFLLTRDRINCLGTSHRSLIDSPEVAFCARKASLEKVHDAHSDHVRETLAGLPEGFVTTISYENLLAAPTQTVATALEQAGIDARWKPGQEFERHLPLRSIYGRTTKIHTGGSSASRDLYFD